MLNSQLKILAMNHKNCIFLNLDKPHFDHLSFSTKVCREINFLIDYADYKFKYNVREERCKRHLRDSLTEVPTCKTNDLIFERRSVMPPKKGTIPFYFNKPLNKEKGSLNNQNKSLNCIELSKKHTPKKGTIPFYFNKILPNVQSVHNTTPANPQVNNDNQFFRS